MKEILFELNDGQIVGLTTVGLAAVWLLLTSLVTAGVVYRLTINDEFDDDPIGNTLVALIVSGALVAIAAMIVRYWQASLIAVGVILLLVGPSILARWLGRRR